ncbi:UDP-N-acetylmuramoyl-tripeptide--D-alanyl-D-alanine ligase [Filimonas lacunae]|uniref:UDP-N-acetylmuramoyl-tripeptide--D-alanyl-D-alanine ligase n=1 Tax=Filimonas lacunae TaxID=477680 RepID=A0A173MS07_9BACT|nr:UDP-N-acetylmuramoyl-tripeptide--D-alanyl-D-alanine ligase [Filimonas lacunae]BAV10277.1 UDP-N-acetylmuramoylalanyl-D-glutamyl-2,6-diaminopimelate-D-alanyl-D-alanine ligase [Filimonas lacunae]SIT17564.1 UDP-N-acetylmuramoyl-tripeptide--D-alanyl-D-alanine ligase [Filimonas lacunae]
MLISELYSLFKQYPSVQTDTRKLQKGDLFFALKGPSFNGNEFALQALEAGAAYAIIDEAPAVPDSRLILVEDALTTLQQLAGYHRDQFTIPFIAITGSNGKTTTKELVNAALSAHYITYTTQGNLNNHIGIPLTLLRVKEDAQMAVIEMGANHQKEIEGYCQYTKPTHGIITNCGKAHLEGFGGIEGVRKGKGELYDYLRANKGTVFAFDDYDYLHDMSKGIEHIVWYGTGKGTITGQVKASEPFLDVTVTGGVAFHTLQTQLVGDYNLPNVLCAITAGHYFQVPDAAIQQAIEAYKPSNSRSQLIEKGTNSIILDAYNANPTSMRAAIQNFAALHAPAKVLLLGAMMELGQESKQEHQALVTLLQQYQWNQVVLVGGDFKGIAGPYLYFENALDAKAWLQQQHFEHTHILVKGSRSTGMERVLAEG